MDDEQSRDIINGKIVNLDKMSLGELQEMRDIVNQNIQNLLEQIDIEVKISDQE